MEKIPKFVFIGIIGVSCFTLMFMYYFGFFPYLESPYNTDNENESKSESDVYNITLIVDYNNGTIKIRKNFSLEKEHTTVFDALEKWCVLKYTEYPNGDFFITSIDGVEGDWQYWVNDDYAGVAANKYFLKDFDEIKWIYG
ncbi:MAG: DUF4430 domain-containing protein [Promethearchaeota archaeon]